MTDEVTDTAMTMRNPTHPTVVVEAQECDPSRNFPYRNRITPSRTCIALAITALLAASCSGGDDSPTGPSSSGPLFQRSGTGNDVIDKPSFVQRLRITGSFSGPSQNFIVWCGTNLLVNEIIGTNRTPTSYSGTHVASNCTPLEIRNSAGVSWTLTEVR
jgi:hypothetical protein